jgi:hypothetical protein
VIDSKELLEEHTFDKEAMDLIVRSEALFLDIYASINNIGLASKREREGGRFSNLSGKWRGLGLLELIFELYQKTKT